MSDSIYFQLGLIVLLGSVAQWLGWRMKLPSILLLLGFGLIAGPATGILKPDQLFGDLLFPIVSASVAVILFEGGLSLRIRELKEQAMVIVRLITIGVLVCWVVAAYLASLFLGMDTKLALLFGAILTVTGPTVIGPMLKAVKPHGSVTKVAKWEGILNDPIGIGLAVIIFEILHEDPLLQHPVEMLTGGLMTILVGFFLSWLASKIIVLLVKRKMFPEYLHNLLILSLVVVIYGFSNLIREESGLLTVTLLGAFLSNQSVFGVSHIHHYKKNLQVLLISCLFIILSARIQPQTLSELDSWSILFLVGLIVLARPLSVIFSTLGSKRLNWRERGLLMFLAPRGIVAVSLTTVLALKLDEVGIAGSDNMQANMIFVVIGTVTVYGLMAPRMAKFLGLAELNPQGVLIIGAHRWARDLALKVQEMGVSIKLIDSNLHNVELASQLGLPAECGNILAEEFVENLNLSNYGHAIAITRNPEINKAACDMLSEFIESHNTSYLPYGQDHMNEKVEHADMDLLFGEVFNYSFIEDKIANGARFVTLKLDDELAEHLDENKIVPFFSRHTDGSVSVGTENLKLKPKSDDQVVFLDLR